MQEPANVVRQWIETIWNAGDLHQIDRFHPPVFDNEGKIVEIWAVANQAAMLQQLGVRIVPPVSEP